MNKINIKKINLKKIVNKYLGIIIYLVILIIFIIVGYFTYQNVYLTSISPKLINDDEIIAKKQKVNLILFEEITKNILDKKNSNTVANINNPFE